MSILPEQIQLTGEQQQKLAELSERTGRAWTDVLSHALASFEHTVASNEEPAETLYDAMVRLGLLGCIDDAPTDLSTNPKYMEGFGTSGDSTSVD